MEWREAQYGRASVASSERLDCVKFEEPVWIKEIRVSTLLIAAHGVVISCDLFGNSLDLIAPVFLAGDSIWVLSSCRIDVAWI